MYLSSFNTFLIILLLPTLFLQVAPNLSPPVSKYYFTPAMESELIHKIQSIPALQTVTLKLFPDLSVKLSNIKISLKYLWSTYSEGSLVCTLYVCDIYIVFDLSLYYYNEESEKEYSDNFIELQRKGLSAILSMTSPSFTIDGSIGWISFEKGNDIDMEISFNDFADFSMFSELIEFEKETATIKNTLASLTYKAINRIFENYPRSTLHEVFDGTWNEVSLKKVYENIKEGECMAIRKLQFSSCKYDSTEKDYGQRRLLFKNVVIHVDFTYEKGGSFGKDITYEVVYVGISQYLPVNGTTPIEEGNCLVKIVGQLLYQAFLRYKKTN